MRKKLLTTREKRKACNSNAMNLIIKNMITLEFLKTSYPSRYANDNDKFSSEKKEWFGGRNMDLRKTMGRHYRLQGSREKEGPAL